MCVLVVQSCLTFCDPVDCSPPGSSAHGILQARILQWVAMFCSRDLPNLGTEPTSFALAGGFFSTGATLEALHQNHVLKGQREVCVNIELPFFLLSLIHFLLRLFLIFPLSLFFLFFCFSLFFLSL